MSREVIILDKALGDLEAGHNFYEKRDFGIGDYFIQTILSDISSLQFHYGEPRKYFGYYRRLSKRFPFAIYYELEGDLVYVVAILDMRMKPSLIRALILDRMDEKPLR